MTHLIEPLKMILELTKSHWDRPGVRWVVRDTFHKALLCRTPALGAEVYASAAGEKVCCHTCKGKGCSSCGNRGTLDWQREQEVLLPDIPFVGFVLTMPHHFWPVFRANRNLQHDLPALGAAAIEQWVWTQHQARLHIIVIQHTFGGWLNYFPHLHIMVSAGGLKVTELRWLESLNFDKEQVRENWQFAVTSYLWKAHRDGLFRKSSLPVEFNEVIHDSLPIKWHVWMSEKMSKERFLGYAGRYIRRPPIAQNRIISVSEDEVFFMGKDAKSGEMYEIRWTPAKFVAHWSQHILDRYKHSMRYFGLLAPRTKKLTSASVFALLGQVQLPKPPRERWADLQKRSFGVDPLIDEFGNRLHWVGRRKPFAIESHETAD
jgi:hypothetical protein